MMTNKKNLSVGKKLAYKDTEVTKEVAKCMSTAWTKNSTAIGQKKGGGENTNAFQLKWDVIKSC